MKRDILTLPTPKGGGECQEHFRQYKGIDVYAALLYEYNTATPRTEELMLAHQKLSDAIESRNLASKPKLSAAWKSNHCMADADGSYVISPNGNLTKCEHYCDTEIIGNIREGITDKQRVLAWKQFMEKGGDCQICAMYPGCIRLQKCPLEGECTELGRARGRDRCIRSMLATWQTWKDDPERLL